MISIERSDRAGPDWVDAWKRLMPQLNPFASPPGQAELDAILTAGATELFAARETVSGRIVGALALVVFTTPTATHAWIEDVVVDEIWRGQGIGEALVRAALERAQQRGARKVDLTSRPAREAANRLYLRMGFAPRDTNIYRFTF
jgi:ribosomal protein S18 acetylase RimI-like enzyme